MAAVSEVAGGVAPLTEVRAIAARALRRQVTIGRVASADAASDLVDGLAADGRLARVGAGVALPGNPTATGPDPVLAASMERLEIALSIAAPPSLADAARETACPPAGIRELERTGRIVILEPDLAYATSTYDEITATALSLAATAPLTPATLRDATGTTRRYVMAILEDLDRRAILRRTADGHVAGPRAPVTAR
jgi:selenocysteine-specific elongation factor